MVSLPGGVPGIALQARTMTSANSSAADSRPTSQWFLATQRRSWWVILAKLEIPRQFRGRGWFRNCIELLYHSMPHKLLVLESVFNR